MCQLCEGSGCERFYKGCCHGFYWNSTTQQCERCMPGYTRENCSSPCPYPQYGVDCQITCNCSRDLCDISTGCISLTTEKDTTASHTIYRVENTTSLAIENRTALFVGNTTVSTEKNHTYNKTQQPSTVKDTIILCIQIFGCVDILLICTYSAVCIYDRQNQTLGKVNTYENVPENNSTYENAEIFFISSTGNQLL